ncbi:MAG: DHH family phosphoesterase [Candidatus Aenigmatarchaeota archaeon]
MKAEAVDFLRGLNSIQGMRLFSHLDADGICSLAILTSFLRKRGLISTGLPPDFFLTDVPPSRIDTAPVMVFTDMSSDTILEYLNRDTLVIDHHIFAKRPACAFYNPRETDPTAYIPASYLVYEVTSEIENMEDLKWVAAVGVLGDKGEENSEICRKFVGQFSNVGELNRVAEYICSVNLVEGNTGNAKMLEALVMAKSAQEIIDNPYFRYCYNDVQNEIAAAGKKVESEGIFRFVDVNSRYNVKSIIAAQLLDKEPGIVVVAYSNSDEFSKMSLRTNTDVNLGEIARKAANAVGGTGGGHEKAAGAKIPKDKFGYFKEELMLAAEKFGAK